METNLSRSLWFRLGRWKATRLLNRLECTTTRRGLTDVRGHAILLERAAEQNL
jgi:hypothetical protein